MSPREQQLIDTYHLLMEVTLGDGRLSDIRRHISPAFKGYGTASDEDMQGYEGFAEVIERQKKQIAAIKLETKRDLRSSTLFSDENAALIVEEIEFTIDDGNDVQSYPVRFSTMFEYIRGQWVVLHIHTSSPDRNILEGEAWPIEELKRHNLELRKLVNKRTDELAQRNRELEIEAALERVRSRTMGMQKSDELPEAANLLFQQVQSLGMPAWSAGYCTWNDDKSAVTAWMSSEGVLQPPFTAPTTEDELFIEMRKGQEMGKSLHVVEMGGKDLVAHYQYMRTLPVVGEILDSIMEAGHPLPTFQIMHHAYFSKGFLLFITYEPVPEAHAIFERFAGVFDQTYTRFLDLQKAEAQAREAQIQLCLERVRASAMGMQSSDDMDDVLSLLFEQYEVLGLQPYSAFRSIIDVPNNQFHLRMTGRRGKKGVREATIRHDTVEAWDDIEGRRQQSAKRGYQILEFKGKDLRELLVLLDELQQTFPEDERLRIEDFPNGLYTYEGHHKHGYLGYLQDRPATEEEIGIVKRFAREFDAVYQRFLDLQKAEAQAREAQIEAALERVRSRAMGMRKSDELMDICHEIFTGLESLGFGRLRNAMVNVYHDDKQSMLNYDYSQNTGKTVTEIPYDLHPHIEKQVNITKSSDDAFFEFSLTGDELVEFRKMRESIGELDDARLDRESALHYYFYSIGSGSIGVSTYGPVDQAEVVLLKRFRNVFNLAYQRYTDIVLAEAQAREAQIEAALERVRSRTMGMQQSAELSEVALELFRQVDQLGIQTWATGFNIWLEGNEAYIDWVVSSRTGKFMEPYTVDLTTHPFFRAISEARKRGDDFFVIDGEGEELEEHYRLLFSFAKIQFEEILASGFQLPERQVNHYVFGRDVSLMFITFDDVPEAHDVFRRFGKVFEQTYTRFLDLQKAEEQAREAQIEAALERVRAKAMAMHNSADLAETIKVFYHQIGSLTVVPRRCGVAHIDQDRRISKVWTMNTTDEDESVDVTGEIKMEGHPVLENVFNYWKRQEDYHPVLRGQEIKEYYQVLQPQIEFPDYPHDVVQYGNYFMFPEGDVYAWTEKELREEDLEIYRRFTSVLSLTYRRYFDLQKAEAQAREAQIEAALERVRSRSMAMHQSDELNEVVSTLYQQLRSLEFSDYGCTIIICNPERQVLEHWYAGEDQLLSGQCYDVPLTAQPVSQQQWNAWQEGLPEFEIHLQGEDKAIYTEFMLTETEHRHFPDEVKKEWRDPEEIYFYYVRMKYGLLEFVHVEPFDHENFPVYRRFAMVFEQTYTRFLDLRRAEARAREAQIEAALERVRSRSMGMQKSAELEEVIRTVHEQFLQLDIRIDHAGFVVDYQPGEDWHFWIADKQSITSQLHVPYFDSVWGNQFNEAKETGKDFFATHLEFEEKNKFYKDLLGLIPGLPEETKDFYFNCPGLAISTVLLDNVALYIENFAGIPYSDEDNDTLMRFGKVFQQTYTRFLDLQRAEAQAREAQIELSLERIRSQAMAMNKSSDLLDIVVTMHSEFTALGHEAHYFWHMKWLPEKYEKAMTSGDGSRIGMVMELPRRIHGEIDELAEWEQSDNPTIVFTMDAESALDYVHKMGAWGDFQRIDPNMPSDDDIRHIGGLTYVMARTTHGEIGYSLPGPVPEPPEAALATLVRFAGVFDLAYRRFEDLKSAERQNRENEIELALERVRSRAMAMQHSDELSDLVAKVFVEMKQMDISLTRCLIWIFDPDNLSARVWMANQEEEPGAASYLLPYHEHPAYLAVIRAWKQRESRWVYDLYGELKESWDDILFSETGFANLPEEVKAGMKAPDRVLLSATFNNFGALQTAGLEPLSEENLDILERFGRVFDLTYTRFHDLQQAEQQARQARIEAALERVRARALAMQQPEELIEVAQVLRQEMGALGVETLETSTIFIYDPQTKSAETWFAIRDTDHPERPLVSDHITMDHTQTAVGREMIRFYESDDVRISIPMRGKERSEWVNYAYALSSEFDGFFGEDIPDRIYHLRKFSHGAIGASAESDLSEESWDLLSRAASVFTLAYSRFLDLTKARHDLILLKEEKQRAEEALAELQATQVQLVHSEKMASLGELTAGIAHEIKNPLNFVNNFSEVSHELLEEMKEELASGNLDEVTELAADVISNLEKILHHGQRADSIVRSMLQHSRGSTSDKELTDLNALADEYLRLAYHGLRAKDKSFNAAFETELAEDLPRVKVIPQEIGRVLLNLINNAFYACNDRKKGAEEGYQPKVIVRTEHQNGKVKISVIDNGGGIPPEVREKIFQPFFTTKPTGQGTGLGLSLSYDIVTKGHGGDLKVDSTPGHGTTFRITLPIDS